MRNIRRCYRFALAMIHLVYAVLLLLLVVGNDPLHRSKRDWYWINHWMRCLCRIMGVKITVHGHPINRPALFVANHISWQDISILQSILSTGFVSKHEVREWPLIGWLAYKGSTLFIRRGGRGAKDVFLQIKSDMVARFSGQQSILVFPEGTTSDGNDVLRFKPRLFEPAVQQNHPIQAIALSYKSSESDIDLAYVDDEPFLVHALRVLGEKKIFIDVYFCEPILKTDKTYKELAFYTEQQVRQALSLPSIFDGGQLN